MPNPAPRPRDLQFLDALRGLLITFVVGIHATRYTALAPGWQLDVIMFVVSTATVKSFFLVDGLLFARSLQLDAAFRVAPRLRASARRLLLPWLLFSALYLALRTFGGRLGFTPVAGLSAHHGSLAAVCEALWYSDTSAQMYFLVSLFVVRACALLCWRALLRCPLPALVALAGALALAFRLWVEPAVLAAGPRYAMDPLLLALGGSAFFIAGMACWRAGWQQPGWHPRMIALLMIVAVAAAASRTALGTAMAEFAYALALLRAFAARPYSPHWLNALGRRTMGIYLIHMPVMLRIATTAVFAGLRLQGVPAYLIVVPLTTALSFGAVMLVERVGLADLLFGASPARRDAGAR